MLIDFQISFLQLFVQYFIDYVITITLSIALIKSVIQNSPNSELLLMKPCFSTVYPFHPDEIYITDTFLLPLLPKE